LTFRDLYRLAVARECVDGPEARADGLAQRFTDRNGTSTPAGIERAVA
jgi:hypothetical protein